MLASERAPERKAFFDVIAGRTNAREGRVWVDRIPSIPAAFAGFERLPGRSRATRSLSRSRKIAELLHR